jgi:hypothetical protein
MRKWAHPPGELMAAHVSRPLTPTGYGRASPACTTESLMLTMSYPRCYRCVSWVLWAPSIGLTLLRKSALPGVYYFRGGLLFCSVGRCSATLLLTAATPCCARHAVPLERSHFQALMLNADAIPRAPALASPLPPNILGRSPQVSARRVAELG